MSSSHINSAFQESEGAGQKTDASNGMYPQIPVINQPLGNDTNKLNESLNDLDCLATVNKLLIRQKVSLCETLSGCQVPNEYDINSPGDQKILHAMENSHFCSRACCSTARNFEMKICDKLGKEIIRLERPLACQSCCFPCCLQVMKVFSSADEFLGTIEQEWSILLKKFSIKNSNGETILKIEGPWFACSLFCQDIDFNVTSGDSFVQVAKISKLYSGCAKEFWTDADNYLITFQPNFDDVKMKSLVLAACFLIDFMHFEKPTSAVAAIACTCFQLGQGVVVH